MIHLNKVEYLSLCRINHVKTVIPFCDNVIDFLDDLSKALMKYKEYADIITFGFDCRRSNILKLKEKHKTDFYTLGRGLIFHIAPANIPVNFAYSWLFGLLSGCSNIIKVSSKDYKQVDIICSEIDNILYKNKYSNIKSTNAFIKYNNDNDITEYISKISDGRIIWGGDNTINHIRQFPLKVRGIDIAFADRYSISVLGSDKILSLNKDELLKLVSLFYKDTYLFDQNGCSSPKIVFWHGNNINKAKDIFWNLLQQYVKEKYELMPIKVVDKYIKLLSSIVDLDISSIKRYGNEVYTMDINHLNQDNLNALFGMFYESNINDLSKISDIIRDNCQTITYFGVDSSILLKSIINSGILGVDRIIPVGQALNINTIWDGYNIINSLTRIIDIH